LRSLPCRALQSHGRLKALPGTLATAVPGQWIRARNRLATRLAFICVGDEYYRPSDARVIAEISSGSRCLRLDVSAVDGQCVKSVARFVFVQLTFGEQFPGDAARVYFVCDGVQHIFVQV
jgi:hypothetical protein